MMLLCRGTLMDGGSILQHTQSMKNYSLIIKKEETSPSTDKLLHSLVSAAPPLSSLQEEGLTNQGNIISNLHLTSL